MRMAFYIPNAQDNSTNKYSYHHFTVETVSDLSKVTNQFKYQLGFKSSSKVQQTLFLKQHLRLHFPFSHAITGRDYNAEKAKCKKAKLRNHRKRATS